MKQKSMSLILMKDEGRTVKVRFAFSTCVIFLLFLLIVPLCLGVSIWMNIQLYKEREEIAQTQVVLQKKVDGNAQKIARLTSLEQFLEARSPNLLDTLIPNNSIGLDNIHVIGIEEEKLTQELDKIATELVVGRDRTQNQAQNQGDGNTIRAEQLVAQKSNSLLVENNHDTQDNNSQNTSSDFMRPASAQASVQSTHEKPINEENISKLQGQDQRENLTITELLNHEIRSQIQEIDLHFVQLEDVHVTANSDSIKINYILRNSGKKSPLTGEQVYYLLSMKDDVLEKTPLIDVTDNSFRIKFMKQVDSLAGLHNIKIQKEDKVLFEIYAQDELIYSHVYSID